MPEAIPTGWCLRPLGHLAEYINGYGFGPSQWGKQGLPIIRIAQITDPQAATDRFRGGLPDQFRVRNGDLLFSWSATLTAVRWNNGDGWLNQHIFRVLPKEHVSPEYLYFLLNYRMDDLAGEAHGSTMRHIKRSDLLPFQVPVPPLDEQRHIAAILDASEATIRATEAVIEKLRLEREGLVSRLFDRALSPLIKEWTSVVIGKVACETALGTTRRGSTEGPTDVPLLKMGNLTWGALVLDDLEPISRAVLDEAPSLQLRDGDLLFNTRNTPELVGKTAVWHDELPICLYDNNLLRLRFSENVSSDFLCLWLSRGEGRKSLYRISTGTTSVAAIYWRDFSKIECPYPTDPNQAREVVRIVFACDRQVQREQEKLSKLRLQHQGILHDLFTGAERTRP